MTRPWLRTPADFAAWSAARPGQLTFAGPDPYYALGLQSLIREYRVACWQATPATEELRRRGVACFVVEESVSGAKGASEDGPTTTTLLERADVTEFVDAGRDGDRPPALLVFKNSHRLEQTCQKRAWFLLASSAALARRWENKVAFRALAGALGLPQPPGLVFAPRDTRYEDLRRQLGTALVIQTPHGYSGARTFAVRSEADYGAVVSMLERLPELRATAYIPGLPLTLNACVTARGVAMGAPCLQLTGMPELTRYPLGSCGNDWSAAARMAIPMDACRQTARQVGEALASEGYRGIFGLDFVMADDGRLWLIEVNPRLVASIALFTQLELAAGRLPLLARHVLAFLDPEADGAPLDAHEAPLSGGQAILHNVGEASKTVLQGRMTGAYAVSGGHDGHAGPVRFLRPALGVDELDTGELLLLAPGLGRRVASGSAYARAQSAEGVVDEEGDLRPAVRRAASSLEAMLA